MSQPQPKGKDMLSVLKEEQEEIQKKNVKENKINMIQYRLVLTTKMQTGMIMMMMIMMMKK